MPIMIQVGNAKERIAKSGAGGNVNDHSFRRRKTSVTIPQELNECSGLSIGQRDEQVKFAVAIDVGHVNFAGGKPIAIGRWGP